MSSATWQNIESIDVHMLAKKSMSNLSDEHRDQHQKPNNEDTLSYQSCFQLSQFKLTLVVFRCAKVYYDVITMRFMLVTQQHL